LSMLDRIRSTLGVHPRISEKAPEAARTGSQSYMH
jgi:hypothetical protein